MDTTVLRAGTNRACSLSPVEEFHTSFTLCHGSSPCYGVITPWRTPIADGKVERRGGQRGLEPNASQCRGVRKCC
jgi:hypothetical protein